MPQIEGPVGRLHYVVTGDDHPTTVFVPGLAQSIADTRPFGSGVTGSRVFVDLRGHGGSAAPTSTDGWSFDGLAADVRAVADLVTASRAVGVSLGAGALVRLLADHPDRFERVVLALPASPPAERSPDLLEITDALADAVEANDPIAIARALRLMQPEAARGRTDVTLWVRRHAAELQGTGVAGALRHLPREEVLGAEQSLAAITAEVLVLAQDGDPLHPVSAAEEVAAAIPGARLVVSPTPWIWSARTALRETVAGFLNG